MPMLSTLKQAVALVLEVKEDHDPHLMVYGKGGHVVIHARILDQTEESYVDENYILTPADARALAAVLIDIAAVEECAPTGDEDLDSPAAGE